MRFYEIKTTTPQQTRINTLKQQKDRLTTQIKNERDKMKKDNALASMRKNSELLAKLRM